jgi:hypothetical protein
MFYLGTITGTSGAYSNQSAGNSGIGTFIIPKSVRALYLVPSHSGISFELLNATSSTGGAATGVGTFQTSVGRGAQLNPNAVNGPFRTIGGPEHIVSIWYGSGGAGVFVSLRVYVEGKP